MDHASATEIRVASEADDVRLSTFIHGFLTDNGYPFIMVRSDPDLTGGGAATKRVMFEDDEISSRFRQQWSAQALGARNTRGGKA